MTYSEALEYIHSVDWKGSRLGLERMYELCEKLGNPQDRLNIIHVAGTNGKGSFCAMLTSVLCEAGLKVGTYTSPYIEYFNERISLCGKPITDDELTRYTERVKSVAETLEDKPTEFELITAIAFLYYSEADCDTVICEVGLGGRLDATNIVKSPLLSVITGIALDHTAVLGGTVEKIAFEKGGIIKENCPVLLGTATSKEHYPPVYRVISEIANERHCKLYTTATDKLNVKSCELSGTVFDFGKRKNIKLKLLGTYQPENAATVINAVDILNLNGLEISEKALYDGFANAEWKARFELLSQNPICIYDGSHNPQGVSAAVDSIRKLFGEQKIILVCGILSDKEFSGMVKALSAVASHAFTVTPDNPRALSANALAVEFRKCGIPSKASDSFESAISNAFDIAFKENRPVFALGSLYMYADIKNAVKKFYLR